MRKEAAKEKASFSKTITITADTITSIVRNLEDNTIFWSDSYKGDEPVGIWITGSGTLDYNFTVVYSDDSCATNLPGIIIKNYFNDIDSIGYVAPKIRNGQTSFFPFIVSNIRYPDLAKRKGLQGSSKIFFTLNTEGRIENITARKGSNIALDKEAIRVIKLVPFSGPATLQGKPQRICVKCPIRFSLN